LKGVINLDALAPHTIWFIVGIVLIVIEIFLIPGTGVLFAGIGAITVGGALILDWTHEVDNQFILFFLSTGIWAGLLWKPLKSLMNSEDSGYSDFIGETAVIYGQPLEKNKKGQLKWSGTIMSCEIAPEESSQKILVDEEVIIVGVSKGILLVKINSSD
jgi:membrane protein implicated in regulation of membrane protease activity